MEKNNKSKAQNINGFTLAEILITLAIIGIIAAITIPSVISNTQQQEFKTGLKKAVSVLNSAIMMNIAYEGESPYDNANLFGYLMRHMSIMETVTILTDKMYVKPANYNNPYWNAAFYTTDGMRYEFFDNITSHGSLYQFKLYESDIIPCVGSLSPYKSFTKCGGCGSLGLSNNPNNTTKPPCIISVDVNGDRKPNPVNANCKNINCMVPSKFNNPNSTRFTDTFSILITEEKAIPYGIAAQKAMYQAQK